MCLCLCPARCCCLLQDFGDNKVMMIVSGTLGHSDTRTLGPTPPAALSPARSGLLSDSFSPSPPAASTTRFHPHPHHAHRPPKSNLFFHTILLIHHQPCDQQTSPHPPLPCDIRPPPHALCKLPAASLQHHHHPPIPHSQRPPRSPTTNPRTQGSRTQSRVYVFVPRARLCTRSAA